LKEDGKSRNVGWKTLRLSVDVNRDFNLEKSNRKGHDSVFVIADQLSKKAVSFLE